MLTARCLEVVGRMFVVVTETHPGSPNENPCRDTLVTFEGSRGFELSRRFTALVNQEDIHVCTKG